jgi:hypothetical protein
MRDRLSHGVSCREPVSARPPALQTQRASSAPGRSALRAGRYRRRSNGPPRPRRDGGHLGHSRRTQMLACCREAVSQNGRLVRPTRSLASDRCADLALSPWRDQRRSGASGVVARRDVADHRERPGPTLLPRRTSGLDRALWDTFPVSVAPSAVDMGVASSRLSSLPVSRTSLRVALLGRSPCRSGARRSRAKPGLPQLAPVCRDAGPARRVRDWKTAGRYEREARCGGRPAGGVACAG